MSTAAVMEPRHEFSPDVPVPERLNAVQQAHPSLWRSLLQLRVLLPRQGKLLPMLEGILSAGQTMGLTGGLTGGVAAGPSAGLETGQNGADGLGDPFRPRQEDKQALMAIEAGQTALRTQLQEQKQQLQGMNEQLLRLHQMVERNAERNTLEKEELAEDLRSASKVLHVLSAVTIGLLVGLAGLVAYLLRHSFL